MLEQIKYLANKPQLGRDTADFFPETRVLKAGVSMLREYLVWSHEFKGTAKSTALGTVGLLASCLGLFIGYCLGAWESLVFVLSLLVVAVLGAILLGIGLYLTLLAKTDEELAMRYVAMVDFVTGAAASAVVVAGSVLTWPLIHLLSDDELPENANRSCRKNCGFEKKNLAEGFLNLQGIINSGLFRRDFRLCPSVFWL